LAPGAAVELAGHAVVGQDARFAIGRADFVRLEKLIGNVGQGALGHALPTAGAIEENFDRHAATAAAASGADDHSLSASDRR
jgi:hypothetical protein